MTVAAVGKAVQVGVGVMIMHQGNVLIGKRIGSHGAGELVFFFFRSDLWLFDIVAAVVLGKYKLSVTNMTLTFLFNPVDLNRHMAVGWR